MQKVKNFEGYHFFFSAQNNQLNVIFWSPKGISNFGTFKAKLNFWTYFWLTTLCELLLQHYFYALHDSTWNHGNPPSIPLLFVRITEKKIDFSKNHKLQKNIARYLLRFTVWQLLRTSLSDLWSGDPFFLKLEFWVRGLISKTMGNDTYCGKNWNLLHMIACGSSY